MSTQIKKIEKEYFLSKLVGEQIPVLYIYNRQDYVFKVDKLTKEEIEFITTEEVEGLVPNKRLNLMFDYKGLVISFVVEIKSLKEDVIKTTIPDVLYKNLDRANSRVAVPSDLNIRLMALEDRYSLPFPKTPNFEPADKNPLPNVNTKNFNSIISQMASFIVEYVDGYKLVYFNTTVAPNTTEEHIISESGKVLFIPSTQGKIPTDEGDKQKYLVTEGMFKRYLESVGVGVMFLDQMLEQSLKTKYNEGIFSEIWVPLLFQEYAVGYIYAWKNTANTVGANQEVRSFDNRMIEKLRQYAACIVFSLKERGYFEAGRLKDRIINGKVVDISASGLRFAVPNSFVFLTLQPDVEIAIKLASPRRTIDAKVKIKRRYKDDNLVYLGCSFLELSPEDSQFLFDFIYGKPTHNAAETLISGNV
jgi:hypothetical protein